MPKPTEEESFFKKYRKIIENLYEKSRLYRDMVYLSKIVRMFIYIATGCSILVLILSGKPLITFEDLIYVMTKTITGKILALLIAFSLIIYGLEKPRK